MILWTELVELLQAGIFPTPRSWAAMPAPALLPCRYCCG